MQSLDKNLHCTHIHKLNKHLCVEIPYMHFYIYGDSLQEKIITSGNVYCL